MDRLSSIQQEKLNLLRSPHSKGKHAKYTHCGFNFQFPEMKGLRASSWVADLAPMEEGANAETEDRVANTVATESFILM